MSIQASPVDAALHHAESKLKNTLRDLADAVRIPSVSAELPPSAAVEQSAAFMAAWMKRIGLDSVEVLSLPDVHPYVFGEWTRATGAPTALIYAHHDVQPPGRPEFWKSPPFEPEVRGGRFYGRGSVDDKAGAAIHFAAIEAYLQTGGLPLNLKVLIDGEEEIGSAHLEAFLEKHRERVQADVIILTDTANLSAGLPSLTYALRGIVVVDVEVQAIDHPLHSGMWGGPVPDSAMALSKILSRLVDDDGVLCIPGIYDRVRPISADERQRLQELPFHEPTFRDEAGMLAGVEMSGEKSYSIYERIWRRPSLAISALEAAPLKGASNQIVSSARARVGIRTVPDMDGTEVANLLERALQRDPPWAARVTTQVRSAGGWWMTDPQGPAYDAACRALKSGFGVDPVFIGCGGSIPFVEPFSRVLGGAKALLLGLEDPTCNAHSENESLHLDDFRKALFSAIHLYDELARAL